MPDGSTVLRARYAIVPSGWRRSSRLSSQSGVRRVVCDDEAVQRVTGRRALEVGQLELAVGRCECVGLERVGVVGVALDQLGERVALELGAQVRAGRAGQVVEPVAVLQLLELRLEHVVERAAQEAAEEVGDLGEAADPQVDLVQAGVGDAVGVVAPGRAVAEHEVSSVGRDRGIERVGGIDDELCGCPLAGDGALTRDGRVSAVGGHEVDQRLGVLEVLTEVRPARVGRELRVVGLGVDLPANVVERRNARLTSTRHVQGRQVEREAQQVVAERLDHELVELVAGLIGRAHDDGARRPARACRAAIAVVEVLGRVQECRQQRERVVGRAAGFAGVTGTVVVRATSSSSMEWPKR